MMHQAESITIVTICDNQFVALMAAMLRSLEDNHHSGEEIKLYIVSDHITEKNRLKVVSSLATTKLRLHWIPIEEALPKQFKLPRDKSSFPANVYMRLCIPYFIPQEATKAIYLDVDMIVLDDISKLWHTDIGNYDLGAVPDLSGVVSSPWGGISNYKALGLDPDSKYLNAGMMLLKPQRWRERNITARAFACAAENAAYLNFAEQYTLNVVFNNDWFELDPLWNWFAKKDTASPYLIHFTGMKPIYNGYSGQEHFKNTFFHYLNKTQWANYRIKSDAVSKLKKIYNKIEKKLVMAFR
ncbi:glycosyltransferase family 8 protein [Pedobacter sp. 22226]|uniref:glycosyltransferase family 8 protein n=1 Tax=Pedobacter sp. 22226 TaxID=3453894 RepID=UPI003F871571